MALRMKSVRPGIPASEMENYQLGIIVASEDPEDVGCLVERRGDKVNFLGEDWEWAWDELVVEGKCSLRVEILEDDTELTVESCE